MAPVSAGVFLLADSSWNRNSRRSPGIHPHRTNRHGSGNHPQSTPFRVREKPLHYVSVSRLPTTLPNTEPPVPVASPKYFDRHARSSTSRRYSASSTKGALSHSGCVPTTSR